MIFECNRDPVEDSGQGALRWALESENMLERLAKVFGATDFRDGGLTFPDIDVPRIARTLRLEERGTDRGRRNEPSSESVSLDAVELEAVDEIAVLRRKGLQHHAEMRSAYAQRLERAGFASQEITQIARSALGEFLMRMTQWRTDMTGPRKDVADAYAHLQAFRLQHKVQRPVYHRSGWPWLIALCLVALIAETALNAGLIAEVHEFGQLGGIQIAALISLVNIAGGGLLGGFARNVNHVNIGRKLIGVLCLIGLVIGAALFNLLAAHLRDVLPGADNFGEITQGVLERAIQNPFGITDWQSGMLWLIGFMVAMATALKAWFSFDPYPGYAAVRREVDAARAAYADRLAEALADLNAVREASVIELRDAQREIDVLISEAMDALYGQSMLRANLDAFLEHCDAKANLLLGLYRDANRAERDTPAPARFDQQFRFELPQEEPAPPERRINAEEARRATAEAIDRAIADMALAYEDYLKSFPGIDEIEAQTETGEDGTVGGRRTIPARVPALKPVGNEARQAEAQRGASGGGA